MRDFGAEKPWAPCCLHQEEKQRHQDNELVLAATMEPPTVMLPVRPVREEEQREFQAVEPLKSPESAKSIERQGTMRGNVKGSRPVYLRAKTGAFGSSAPGASSRSAAFKELLRKLEEEHDKAIDLARDALLTANRKLREENSQLRAEGQRQRSELRRADTAKTLQSQACQREFTSSGSSPGDGRRRHSQSTCSGSEPWGVRGGDGPPLPSRWSVARGSSSNVVAQTSDVCNTFSVIIHTRGADKKEVDEDGNLRDGSPSRSLGVRSSRKTSSTGFRSENSNMPPQPGYRKGDDDLGKGELERVWGHQQHDRCMLSPVSRVRLVWDFIAFSCLLVDLWKTPVEMVFMRENSVPSLFRVLNWIITSFFVLDILFNFNTGYIERDKLVMQRVPSIKKYLQLWFWIDMVATVPFDLFISEVLTDSDMASMTRLARLTKVTKVLKTLRFLKMLRAIRLVQQIGRTSNFVDMFEPFKYVARLLQMLTALGFMAHFHGCAWALLIPDMAHQSDAQTAFRHYYQSFRWAYNALTVGDMDSDTGNPGVWTLEMIIATERILVGCVVGGWGIVKALSIFQEDAQLNLVKAAAVRFFRQHEVSIETQISVMYSLQETREAQKMQRHFKSLMSEHLPDELRRTVSEELWVPHLMTLGLISEMKPWHQDFLPELALLVREEVVAPKTVLCKEGHAAIAAYYILKGRLVVSNSHSHGSMPDFVDGMWVEETALVSPVRRRTHTVVTPILSRLMTVPTQAFHELIATLGLDNQFQELRETKLARGVCGRCGDVGDHFTHACPLAQEPRQRLVPLQKSRLSLVHGLASLPVPGLASLPRPSVGKKLSWSTEETEGTLSLNAFLHAHRLTQLAPWLAEKKIHSRSDLEELDYDELHEELADEEMRRQLSLLHVLVKEQQEQQAFQAVGELESAQHLAFLSHYKLESGTEAALMRAEIERVLLEDPESPAHGANVPIFLDSEDLSDLEELEEHVKRSHNLVLLLTKDVLLRPWVLVEIVTAIETEVRVMPVEVNKKGAGFTFPDEDFYARFAAGKVLDHDGQALLRERGIELQDVVSALREVFNKIALPYSPHRSESIRMAEIKAIYKQLQFTGANKTSSADKGSTRKPQDWVPF